MGGWLFIQQPVGLFPLAQCHIVIFVACMAVNFWPTQVRSQKMAVKSARSMSQWLYSTTVYSEQGRVHCAHSSPPIAYWYTRSLCSSRQMTKCSRQSNWLVPSHCTSTMVFSHKNIAWNISISSVLDIAALAPSQLQSAWIVNQCVQFSY
jgi:hypothetical protein